MNNRIKAADKMKEAIHLLRSDLYDCEFDADYITMGTIRKMFTAVNQYEMAVRDEEEQNGGAE